MIEIAWMVSLCGATIWVLYQIGYQEYQKSVWSMFKPKPSVKKLVELGFKKMSQEIDNMGWADIEIFVTALQCFMDGKSDETKSD